MAEPQTARADEASEATVYVVSYLEVMPPSTAEAAALLRQYREASRTDTGHVHLEVLQQSGRPDHFAIVEVWQDQKAFEAHGSATPTRDITNGYSLSASAPTMSVCIQVSRLVLYGSRTPQDATYVVTHADAIPAGKDDAIVLLQQLAEASRNDRGSVRLDVLQQRSRQNHFTIVEIWQDQKAFEAHAMATHTRQFREQFHPLSGSLYDERLYQTLD